MLLEAKNRRGKVIDLDSGREVRAVRWVNIDNGTLECYRLDGKGQYARDENGDYILDTMRGRFAFVPREAAAPSARLGAPRCARCPSTLTLAGDDLCPVCRARERGQRHKMTVERMTNPLLDRKCQGCSRLAEFVVSDEVIVSPVVARAGRLSHLSGKNLTWERGMTVNRRYYCSWCFRPPRLVDARGEVIGDVETKLRPT